MYKRVILVLLIVGAIICFVFADKIGLYFDGAKKTVNAKEQYFYVDKDYSLKELGNKLLTEKLIDDTSAFNDVGEYKNLEKGNLAMGKYLIEPGTNYKTLLNGFTKNSLGNGNAELEVKVKVPSVSNLLALSGKISQQLNIDSTELADYLFDPATLRQYGFSAEEFPAMFFANTYSMYWDTDKELFVERMAVEFKTFWTSDRIAKIQKSGLKSQSKVSTLASIVYSEQSIHPEEWPVIARLYLNRIEQGIKLQSDPTFKFCWGDDLKGVQRLLNIHRNVDCPYNTYKINGLPPGPIALVPSGVIDAVLNPDKNDYIYMCAKPDNSLKHNFTSSYAVHSANALAYHRFMDRTK